MIAENPTKQQPLAVEQQTYFENKVRLLNEAEGQYVLIVDDQVIGTFHEWGDALDTAYARFGIRPVFVHLISRDEAVIDVPSVFGAVA